MVFIENNVLKYVPCPGCDTHTHESFSLNRTSNKSQRKDPIPTTASGQWVNERTLSIPSDAFQFDEIHSHNHSSLYLCILLYWSPQGITGNVHFLRNFGYWPCSLEKMMKFSINKRHSRKTRRVSHNQHLKNPIQLKCRESSNFVFLFSQLCKNGHSLIFSWRLHIVLDGESNLEWYAQ